MGQSIHNEECNEPDHSGPTKNICPICGQRILLRSIGWGTYSSYCEGKSLTCEEELRREKRKVEQESEEAQNLFAEYDKKNEALRKRYPHNFPFFFKKSKPFSSKEMVEFSENLKQKIASFLELAAEELWLKVENGSGYLEITLIEAGQFRSVYNGKRAIFSSDKAEEMWQISSSLDLEGMKKKLANLALQEKVAEFFYSNFLPEEETFDKVLFAKSTDKGIGFQPDFGDRQNRRVIFYDCSLNLEEGRYGVRLSPEISLGRKDKRGYDMFKRRVIAVERLY